MGEPRKLNHDRPPQPITRRRGTRSLHCAYFAAGETAARYGIGFDRVILHLWTARSVQHRLQLRNVRFMDDLIHALACADGNNLAWADLAGQYERMLARKCLARMDEVQATLFVRRLFAALRRRLQSPIAAHSPCLRSFNGTRPLRVWLTERLNAALAQPDGRAEAPRSIAIEWNPSPTGRSSHPSGPLIPASAAPAGPDGTA